MTARATAVVDRRAWRTMGWVLLLWAVGWGTAACQKPILRPNEPRSQFDRYDALRNERAEAYIEDEFGTRRANVRGRLLGR